MITPYLRRCTKALRSNEYLETVSNIYLSSLSPNHSLRHSSSSSSSSTPSSSQTHSAIATTTSPPSQKSQTYYDLFPLTLFRGPPPVGPFSIDIKRLRAEFLQLQAKAHPDRFSSTSSSSSSSSSRTGVLEAKRQAESLSAHINTAYKTLQSPLLRAQYLLSLRGIRDTSADESATTPSTASATAEATDSGQEDPELLMTVMEMREAIEGAQEERDLEEVAETNRKLVEESVQSLEEAFGKDDLEWARAEVVRLKYWIGVEEGIKDWEKEDGKRESVGRRDWSSG